MSQGVSRRPLTAETRIRLQDSPSEICGGRSGNNKGFCVSGFPLSVPFHQCYLNHFYLHVRPTRRKNGRSLRT